VSTTIECSTQAALDKALKAAKPGDIIACIGKGRFSISGSSTVSAYGSSTVWASGSSTVRAYGSSTVTAYGSSTVWASKYVAIHRQGKGPKVSGGVLIDVPDPATLSPTDWCEYQGVTVTDGVALLYKAVDDDYATDYARRAKLAYTPGTEVVEAPDWRKTKACGNGLHASPRPDAAVAYNPGATRYVEVRARLDELVMIDDKIKAPRLYGPFTEVDIHGRPVVEAAS
jgi:hypothetical protein